MQDDWEERRKYIVESVAFDALQTLSSSAQVRLIQWVLLAFIGIGVGIWGLGSVQGFTTLESFSSRMEGFEAEVERERNRLLSETLAATVEAENDIEKEVSKVKEEAGKAVEKLQRFNDELSVAMSVFNDPTQVQLREDLIQQLQAEQKQLEEERDKLKGLLRAHGEIGFSNVYLWFDNVLRSLFIANIVGLLVVLFFCLRLMKRPRSG